MGLARGFSDVNDFGGEMFVLLFAALFQIFAGVFVMFFFPSKKNLQPTLPFRFQKKKPSDSIWVCLGSTPHPVTVANEGL